MTQTVGSVPNVEERNNIKKTFALSVVAVWLNHRKVRISNERKTNEEMSEKADKPP